MSWRVGWCGVWCKCALEREREKASRRALSSSLEISRANQKRNNFPERSNQRNTSASLKRESARRRFLLQERWIVGEREGGKRGRNVMVAADKGSGRNDDDVGGMRPPSKSACDRQDNPPQATDHAAGEQATRERTKEKGKQASNSLADLPIQQ